MVPPRMNFLTLACRDPEGNTWDVAWKVGSEVADDGSLTWDPEPPGAQQAPGSRQGRR